MEFRTQSIKAIVLSGLLTLFICGDLWAQHTPSIPRSKPGQPTDSTQLEGDKNLGAIPHNIPEDCGLGKNIVYGFHPNWRTNPRYINSYNFNLLSHLNYFSYIVDCETGGVQGIGDFHTTSLFETARAKNPNIRIDLTLSMGTHTVSGSKRHCPSIDFLKNETAVENCINTVKGLMEEKKLDGICVDFEDINHNGRTQDTLYYSRFLAKLRKGILEVNPDGQLSVAGYASGVTSEQNLMGFRESLDFVVIMGYDYYGSFSKVVGPVAPINQNDGYWLGLSQTVNAYIKGGMTKNQLVLALPYYGNEWFTKGTTSKSPIVKWRNHITFGQLSYREGRFDEHWDAATGESFYTKSGPGYDSLDWVPNAKAMNLKFQFVKSRGLAGTGIWALGYDYPSTALWDLLHSNFSECETSPVPPPNTSKKVVGTQNTSQPTPGQPVSTSDSTGTDSSSLSVLPSGLKSFSWIVSLIAILGFFFLALTILISRKARQEILNRYNIHFLQALLGVVLLITVHELLAPYLGRFSGGLVITVVIVVLTLLLGYHFGRKWERERHRGNDSE